MVKRYRHGSIFRCSGCGQFIAYNDIPSKVKVKFIPSTNFTIEETIFTHKICL